MSPRRSTPWDGLGFSEAIDDLPLAVALVDPEGFFLWRNPAWTNLDPIRGMPFIWPLDFWARVRSILADQSTSVIRSVKHRDRNAAFDLWLRPLAGSSEAAWIVATDVTLYEQAALAELVDARVHEASIMIQGILHEMRNPLAGIKAMVQLIKRGKAGADLGPYLEQILSDIGRMDDVLQELTILAGPLKLRTEPTNLHRLLDEAIATLESYTAQREVRIERHYDPSLPEVDVDPDRLYRVYLNLLRNAVDASPPGATVEVHTHIDREWWPGAGGEHDRRSTPLGFTTRICDEGDGIDPKARLNVFTPLYTTKKTGTGLGLPVSLQIIQAHAGVLRLGNRSGRRGAEAVVTVPLVRHGGSDGR